MDAVRASIIAEAQSWLGTPYHHRAQVKGVGVDCAMLPIAVYSAVGVIKHFTPEPYPPDWMLHRSEERFLGYVQRFAVPTATPQPGEVALFRFGRCVSHAGIICEPGYMIHADLRAGCVCRTEIATYADRLHSFWSVPGV
ncbi:MAG: NlpC/P60 family protein [Steroidobacteraceae bacterium]